VNGSNRRRSGDSLGAGSTSILCKALENQPSIDKAEKLSSTAGNGLVLIRRNSGLERAAEAPFVTAKHKKFAPASVTGNDSELVAARSVSRSVEGGSKAVSLRREPRVRSIRQKSGPRIKAKAQIVLEI